MFKNTKHFVVLSLFYRHWQFNLTQSGLAVSFVIWSKKTKKTLTKAQQTQGLNYFAFLRVSSTKNFVQCKKSFLRAMSKFKTHVSDCTPSQVAGCSQILSWTELMFSKRLCYDFLNLRSKCRKRECFESSAWQIECFES